MERLGTAARLENPVYLVDTRAPRLPYAPIMDRISRRSQRANEPDSEIRNRG